MLGPMAARIRSALESLRCVLTKSSFLRHESLAPDDVAELRIGRLLLDAPALGGGFQIQYLRTIQAPAEIAAFLRVVDAGRVSKAAKVHTTHELDVVLRGGNVRHYRIARNVVRPRIPGSAVGPTWKLEGDGLATFLPQD